MPKEIRKLGARHQLRPVNAKAFVATPAYDGHVLADYAMSLADSVVAAAQCDIAVMASVMGNGAFIEIARNVFVKQFLETDCTHLFFIDADLKWESRAFVGLINANRPVSAGAYRRRQEPEDYPLHYLEDPAEPGLSIIEGGWIPCDRVATGFLCIRRDVVEAMAAVAPKWKIREQGSIPALFYTKLVEQTAEPDSDVKGFVGEDFSWCDDYMDKFRPQFGNQPIMVWPDFDFVHNGYKGNWLMHINKEVAEYERKQKEEEAAEIAA